MPNILYIGRFQPFHKGHADAVLQILNGITLENKTDIYNIFIGIGSAETNFTESNPLTSGERFEIINAACVEILEIFLRNNANISKNNINFHIIPIRNIDHYALWPYHVQQYLPKIDIFYSGSPLVLQLWKNAFAEAKINKIQKNKNISGTEVRSYICNNDGISENNIDMTKYCLDSTVKLLKRLKLSERLQNMKTY